MRFYVLATRWDHGLAVRFVAGQESIENSTVNTRCASDLGWGGYTLAVTGEFGSFSMNTRSDEPSLRNSIPMTDREHIGVRRGGAAARRAASPLRTTGCLKSPHPPRYAHALLGPLEFVPDLCSLADACSG
jgi:hypothetical protein